MKYSKQVKLLKEHGFVFYCINNWSSNQSAQYKLPELKQYAIQLTKTMTTKQLLKKIEEYKIIALDLQNNENEYKARRRRKSLRNKVIEGGKWHNLPTQSKAKLTLVKAA